MSGVRGCHFLVNHILSSLHFYARQFYSKVTPLSSHIFSEATDSVKRVHVDWKTQLYIIGEIARGLLYLPENSYLRIIHRDLKVSNIYFVG